MLLLGPLHVMGRVTVGVFVLLEKVVRWPSGEVRILNRVFSQRKRPEEVENHNLIIMKQIVEALKILAFVVHHLLD